MAQINEKPRKRRFTLELDEDEVAELITWADNPADDFVRGETGDALLRTLRRALSGPTRKSEGDNAGEPAKRSRTHCPTCESPEPSLHPAVSGGGEVTHICNDPFHGPVPQDPAPVRSQTFSGVAGSSDDRQHGRTIDVGEGQQWIARD